MALCRPRSPRRIPHARPAAGLGSVADDHHVHVHGLDIQRRVDKRLALGQAAAAGSKFDRVRPQPPCGQRETVSGPRRAFEDKIACRFALQFRQLASKSPCCRPETIGRIQDRQDFLRGEILQSQQVVTIPAGGVMGMGRPSTAPTAAGTVDPPLGKRPLRLTVAVAACHVRSARSITAVWYSARIASSRCPAARILVASGL